MHDCMQYNPIQRQGHERLKVGNPSIFKSYLLRHLQRDLATLIIEQPQYDRAVPLKKKTPCFKPVLNGISHIH